MSSSCWCLEVTRGRRPGARGCVLWAPLVPAAGLVSRGTQLFSREYGDLRVTWPHFSVNMSARTSYPLSSEVRQNWGKGRGEERRQETGRRDPRVAGLLDTDEQCRPAVLPASFNGHRISLALYPRTRATRNRELQETLTRHLIPHLFLQLSQETWLNSPLGFTLMSSNCYTNFF